MKEFHNKSNARTSLAMARVINNLIEAIQERKCLPKFIIVFLDNDLLLDIDVYDADATKIIQDCVRWTVRQIDTIIKRKRMDFLEKKPGAVAGFTPTTIYVRMLRRVGKFAMGSKLNEIFALRAKFNDTLNDSVAKVGQRIMTISSCNTFEDFDRNSHLSSRG